MVGDPLQLSSAMIPRVFKASGVNKWGELMFKIRGNNRHIDGSTTNS
jgi:hypothetical protein